MRKRPFPITQTPPRCLKKCHFCFHYHESGMSGENGMGYCFKWTWQHDQRVLVKRDEVCPQFFRSIPLVSSVWGGVELGLLNRYDRMGALPWSTTKREVIVDTDEAGNALPNEEQVFKSIFAFAEVVHQGWYEAYIEVILRRTGAGHEVVEALPADPNREKWATNGESHPEWAASAIDGINEALAIVSARTGEFYRIELAEIRAKDAYAAVDVVKCAVALAVFRGIFPGDKTLTAVFEDFEWRLCENPDPDSQKHSCHITEGHIISRCRD